MNNISTFEYRHEDLHEFENTRIYYIKIEGKHQLILENSIVEMYKIYMFKYIAEKDSIIIYYTSSKYSGITTLKIVKGTLDNVFELFEWLVPKLTTLT